MSSQKPYIEIEQQKGEYYIRLQVKDEQGVLAKISDIFSSHSISLERILQKPVESKDLASIMGVTHDVVEKNINKAMSEITDMDCVLGKPSLIRIEP